MCFEFEFFDYFVNIFIFFTNVFRWICFRHMIPRRFLDDSWYFHALVKTNTKIYHRVSLWCFCLKRGNFRLWPEKEGSVIHSWLILGSSRFYALLPHFGRMNINYDEENNITEKNNEHVSWETDWMIFIQLFRRTRKSMPGMEKTKQNRTQTSKQTNKNPPKNRIKTSRKEAARNRIKI